MSVADVIAEQPAPSMPAHQRELRRRRRRRGRSSWTRKLAKLDWFGIFGAAGDVASVADVFGGWFGWGGEERRLSTGGIDWQSGKGAEADDAIHNWMNKHLVEVEGSMEPNLKSETLTHPADEIEDALTEGFEEFVENHREEIVTKLREIKEKQAATDAVVSKVESHMDGGTGLADARSSSILVGGVFSLLGMAAFFVATRSGFQQARLYLASHHHSGLQQARVELGSQPIDEEHRVE